MRGLALAASCINAPPRQDPPPPTDADYELELGFEKGAAPVGNIIHAAWIENRGESFFKYIFISERLLKDSSKQNIPIKKTCPYWWTDQPAILYAADVDLSGGEAEIAAELTARGWSRNYDDENGSNGGNGKIFPSNPPDRDCAIGSLNTELRYITRRAESGGTGFGTPYGSASASDAANMTASLALAATRL